MKNSISSQKGNFTVEFAIVGVFFSLLLVFSGDLIMKLSVRGKLDRMSYSAVSVLKERTELFGEDTFTIDNAYKQAPLIYQVVTSSLQRTMSHYNAGKFRFVLDLRNGTSTKRWISPGEVQCTVTPPSEEMLFTTSWGRSATLYQITLCYDTDNWFGDLMGQNFRLVTSRVIIMGR